VGGRLASRGMELETETRRWERADGTVVELEMRKSDWDRWDKGEPVGSYGDPLEVLTMDEVGSTFLRRRLGL
jgi:hypothetical protein